MDYVKVKLMEQGFKTFQNLDCKHKKVLLRLDLNLDTTKQGEISDTYRLRAVLPTLKDLLRRKTKKIIIAAHWDRPGGRRIERWSMQPIASLLAKELNLSLPLYDLFDFVDREEERVVILENLRFYRGEEENDREFSQRLASLADIFINDAFASSHRSHSSIVGITEFLPSFAGPLLKKEVDVLTRVRDKPQHPALLLIGGAKIVTKLPLVDNLLGSYNYILVGGIIGNTIASLRGQDLKESLVEDEELTAAERKLLKEESSIITPQDFVWHKEKAFDIGPKSREQFKEYLKKAETIVWNGPLGLYEERPFDRATQEIGRYILDLKAYTVLGGGDTIDALHNLPIFEKIDFISTGGGAMLKFLSGEELVGLKALQGKY